MIDYKITLVFTLDLCNSMKISNEMYHSILVMIQMQKNLTEFKNILGNVHCANIYQ